MEDWHRDLRAVRTGPTLWASVSRPGRRHLDHRTVGRRDHGVGGRRPSGRADGPDQDPDASSATACRTSSRSPSTTCTSTATTRTSRPTSSRCRTCSTSSSSNGTLLSNNHTPLIAHTADDSLTNYTGLYGDRHGQGITNRYETYNTDGTTDPAGSFAYWTDPVFDTRRRPTPATTPTPPWCTRPPRRPHDPAAEARHITPGAVGAVHARRLQRRRRLDAPTWSWRTPRSTSPKVFGPSSPEVAQLQRRHRLVQGRRDGRLRRRRGPLRPGRLVLLDCDGVKFGQTSPSPTATPDVLPTEPGGYNGFQALFGHRYLAPQLGRRRPPNLTRNGYPGHQRRRQPGRPDRQPDQRRLPDQPPGLPGLRADQRRPVARLRGRHAGVRRARHLGLHRRHPRQRTQPRAHPGCADARRPPSGPGDACYVAQAQAYDAAFATFFQRLAADGINAEQHRVRHHGRRGRPRGRRQRGPGRPAHAGQLRRGDRHRDHRHAGRRLHLPGRQLRGAGHQHHRAAGHPEGRHHPLHASNPTRRPSST